MLYVMTVKYFIMNIDHYLSLFIYICIYIYIYIYIYTDRIVHERRKVIANALELRLSCTNASICLWMCKVRNLLRLDVDRFCLYLTWLLHWKHEAIWTYICVGISHEVRNISLKQKTQTQSWTKVWIFHGIFSISWQVDLIARQALELSCVPVPEWFTDITNWLYRRVQL